MASVRGFNESNIINVKILDELDNALNITDPQIEKKDGPLKDKTFLVTGKLRDISRAEIKSLIEENSGTILSSVSKKLNYLISGDKSTKRKIESAKQLKIKIINLNEFLRMINKVS